ncbi:MAG: 4-(cytidine 5'-diphospho)-2-C-methyl-D-erythritol kinase [Lachnospiraceae bacterium]|nr:4-(cytidine 5'-diphospho)-2-C-methyl-D-erythritol kinase [Lachnospiraceae bacterium]
MQQIIEKAYAKINLGLHITGKRPDGYHTLSMLMQTVSLYDEVVVYRTNDSDEISMDMDFGGRHPEEEITCDGDNLCVKAAKLICGKLPESHGYYMHLVKNIPSAAGMAGGSSDAAAVLRGINRLEGDYFSKDELLRMALKLGADVPYCIDGGLCLCEGIGEQMTPIEADLDAQLLLAKPAEGVSTPEAYRYFDEHPAAEQGSIEGVIEGIRKNDIFLISENIHNDLEDAAKHFCPSISEIEELMLTEGALLSEVTGSGPTIFGIFDTDEARRTAAEALRTTGLCPDIIYANCIRPDYD